MKQNYKWENEDTWYDIPWPIMYGLYNELHEDLQHEDGNKRCDIQKK